MNHYGGKELAAAFRTVRKNTIQTAEDIPESEYGFKATPETRTIAQTLVHIAFGPEFAFAVHGNKITDMTKLNFPGAVCKESARKKPRFEPRPKSSPSLKLRANALPRLSRRCRIRSLRRF